MAIKKFNRKMYESELEPDAFSKTQQKNESLAIKKFGLELTELPAKILAILPISEVTLKSLLDYQKMNTNLAKKRHIMFIGKCLRNEDEQAIRDILDNQAAINLKEKTEKEINKDPVDGIIERLVVRGDVYIDELLANNPVLERQTLRQILRNIKNAKKLQKKQIAINKMQNYLRENLD